MSEISKSCVRYKHKRSGDGSNVFNGLGTIGEEYTVKLKENATPYALFVPRNVPIPLRQKVKEELDRMEKMKVITKVEKPTQWCAGMIVVPKKSGVTVKNEVLHYTSFGVPTTLSVLHPMGCIDTPPN